MYHDVIKLKISNKIIIRYKLLRYLNTFLIILGQRKRNSSKHYKTTYLSMIYVFNVISINIAIGFFSEMGQNYSNIHLEQ